MTISFKDDRDVIVYALERIICYARDNRYILIAKSVWWIASIIGLSEELVMYIDSLWIQVEKSQIATKEDQLPSEKHSSVVPQEHPSTGTPKGYIHPDRLSQIDRNSESLEAENSEDELVQSIIQGGNKFVNESRKARKAYTKKPSVLSRTRSGKIPVKPLTKKQRNRLQAISKDTLSAYLAGR